MKIQDYAKQYLNKLALLMLTAPVILMTAGCDEIDGGQVQNTVQLPVDSVLNFRCEDEGIFPDDCVLDNPENPYVSVAITEDNKFDLADDAPSAKSRYYLWATALARGAGLQGENQYYTAVSLHEVYGESGSPTTRDQARKAYRSVLDNFFLAPSFFKVIDVLPDYELLANGGIGSPEATGGDVFCHTGWACENESYTTATDGPNSAPVSHNPEDNQSIKQFANDALSLQVVNATPGRTYQASVWAMNWTGNGTTDPFTESGFMELSFLDAAGNAIPGSQQYVYVDAVDDGTNVYLPPQDGAEVSDWTELTISAVAPDGTVSARMLLTHKLAGGSGGTLRWDDASINAVDVDVGGNVNLPPQDGADVSDWRELSLTVVAPEGAASVKLLLQHQLAGGSGGSLRWDDASIITEATISFALKDLVGANLYDPNIDDGLVSLYPEPSQALALSDISNWGYVYDPVTGIMSEFRP